MDGFKDNLTEDMEKHYQRAIVTRRYWDPEEAIRHITLRKVVLNALRGYLGEENFFRGIRHYIATHKISVVETSDFRKSIEEASGLDLESFFEQWVYSPGYPEIKANNSWDDDNKTANLEVEQTNAEIESVPLFTTPIEV